MCLSVCLAAACGPYTQSATRGSEGFETAVVYPQTTSARTLGRRDIAPFEARPLADALSRLRPDWLRPTQPTRVNGETGYAVVYLNDVLSGDIAELQTIATDAVIEVRLLSVSEAWARYGPQCRCPAGAILVRTRAANEW